MSSALSLMASMLVTLMFIKKEQTVWGSVGLCYLLGLVVPSLAFHNICLYESYNLVALFLSLSLSLLSPALFLLHV